MNDPFVGMIERTGISTFLDALGQLPNRYGQIPIYRQKNLSEMLHIAKLRDLELPKIGIKTLNRHASAISGLFTWAKKHGEWNGENLAHGFIDKKSVKRARRRPWKQGELVKLFSSAPWKGCKSKAIQSSA